MKSAVVFVVMLALRLCAAAQEIESPFESDSGRVMMLTSAEAYSYNVLTEFLPFDEARLLLQPDGSFVLEFSLETDGRRSRSRVTRTQAEVDSLRSAVASAMKILNVKPSVNQDGRVMFLTAATVYSLGWLSPALLNQIDDHPESSSVGGVLLVCGLTGFFVPLLATANQDISEAQYTLMAGGLFGGTFAGNMLYRVLDDESTTHTYTTRDYVYDPITGTYREKLVTRSYTTRAGFFEPEIGRLLLSSAAGAAGMYAGNVLAKQRKMNVGAARMINTAGLFGAGIGLFGTYAFDDDASPRSEALGSLLGLGAGVGVGLLAVNAQNFGPGDATVVSSLSLSAGLIGLGLAFVGDSPSSETVYGLMAAGAAAGLGLGIAAVANKDFTEGQGNIVQLSMAGGMLVGAGFALMTGGGDGTPLMLGLGALAGCGVSYGIFSKEARKSKPTKSTGMIQADFQISPLGLAALLHPVQAAVPLASLTLRR